MITSVLVANRGEIARRVFRTCAELGIATVAVHSDADAGAPHVREADAAVRLPGDAPADTYLRGGLIVDAALAAGADAVHPGYGFLSENAQFARAVLDAGLVWIGPPPEAIEAMASKTRAKKLMSAAGVPLLEPVRAEEARESDLPLLVKAAAGGGGRGMRVVRELAALEGEFAAAQAEAAAAFGDGEVFAEPYVERGRHVEVQVLADGHGAVWTLGTRDCSLQRRHQKVLEEAPAPALGDELRELLHESAAEAARAVDYRGAGTVEFLVAGEGSAGPGGRAYFLEMNTRLQVEHPVTECVHGVDLVALQIRVAEGEPLDPGGPPAARGHAVEARLYAEDPARDWQPQTGTLHRLHVPGAGGAGGVRLDSGVADGDVIKVHYDPMLAKVVAWAPTRREAVRKLASALERAQVHGPVTNRELLLRSLRHPDFVQARLDTGFYDRHLGSLTGDAGAGDDADGASAGAAGGAEASEGARAAGSAEAADGARSRKPARALAGSAVGPRRLAALAAALADAERARAAGGTVSARLGGWRNVPAHPQVKTYRAEPSGQETEIRYRLTRDGLHLPDGDSAAARVRLLHAAPDRVTLEVDGVRRDFTVSRYGEDGSQVYVDAPPPVGCHAFTALPRLREPRTENEPGSLLAPMPGTVSRVVPGLAVGAAVEAGEPLLWLEAMKMEHKVVAPASGTLTALHAKEGRQVEVGELLAVVDETDAGAEGRSEEALAPSARSARGAAAATGAAATGAAGGEAAAAGAADSAAAASDASAGAAHSEPVPTEQSGTASATPSPEPAPTAVPKEPS